MTKIQVTEDGSHTLFSEMAGQTYHSSHGAVQESRHIFISQLELVNSQQSTVNSQQTIDNGQRANVDSQQLVVNSQQSIVDGDLSVLEIGFGTGLNALLAACCAAATAFSNPVTLSAAAFAAFSAASAFC